MSAPGKLMDDLITFFEKRRIEPADAIVATLTTAIIGLVHRGLTLEQAHTMFDDIWLRMLKDKADLEARNWKP